MKALSVKNPYARWIATGYKTIETRTWKTDYRGELLICASKKPVEKSSGMAICLVELVDVRPMTKKDWRFAQCPYYPNAYGWIFKNIRQITKPFPVKGKLRLFEVELPVGQSTIGDKK